MSDDLFVNTKEFRHFLIRNLTNELERKRDIDLDNLGQDERLKMKDEILKATNQQLATMMVEREIVKRSGVLLLEGWNIYFSIIFYELRRRQTLI